MNYVPFYSPIIPWTQSFCLFLLTNNELKEIKPFVGQMNDNLLKFAINLSNTNVMPFTENIDEE